MLLLLLLILFLLEEIHLPAKDLFIMQFLLKLIEKTCLEKQENLDGLIMQQEMYVI